MFDEFSLSFEILTQILNWFRLQGVDLTNIVTGGSTDDDSTHAVVAVLENLSKILETEVPLAKIFSIFINSATVLLYCIIF